MFENLTPLFPKEQFKLERDIKAKRTSPAASSTSSRRSAKASATAGRQPKTGKTVMMQNIAHAITANHPDVT